MVDLTKEAREFFMTLVESKGVLELTADSEHPLAMELSDAGYAKVIRTPTGPGKIESSGLTGSYSRKYESRVELTPQGRSYLDGYFAGMMEGMEKSIEAITTELGSTGINV